MTMKSGRRMVSFRLPTDLLANLDHRAAERRLSRSQLVIELLEAVVSCADPELPAGLKPPPRARRSLVDSPDDALLLVTGPDGKGPTQIAGLMTVREFAESNQPMDRLSDGDRIRHMARIADLRGKPL